MKHLIVAAADRKVESFVVDHWIASLRATTDLSDIDVMLLDYGFSDEVKRRLDALGVIRVEREAHGIVGNQRFVDLVEVLEGSAYGNVLFCDCGDLIFQRNVSPMLVREPYGRFCAMRDMPTKPGVIIEFGLGDIPLRKFLALQRKYARVPFFNVGVVFGTASHFIGFGRFLSDSTTALRSFGTDQMIFGEYADLHGCDELDATYNFMAYTHPGFEVEHGVVSYEGEVVHIVHNNGRRDGWRAFSSFGYGPDRNVPRARNLRASRFFLKA